jgi:hypothetical protein
MRFDSKYVQVRACVTSSFPESSSIFTKVSGDKMFSASLVEGGKDENLILELLEAKE